MVGGGVYSGETTSVYTQLYRVPTVNPTRTTMIKNANTRTPRIMKTVIPRDELVDGESVEESEILCMKTITFRSLLFIRA